MRTLVLGASAALFSLGLAAPALAQDGPPPSPYDDAAPARLPFTGARAGVLLGYDRLQPGSGSDSDIGGDNHADGLSYGGDFGYDFDAGHFVIGAEGEVAGSTGKVSNNPINAAALGYGRVKAGRDLYAGVRAGIKAGPKTLVYVKGGYTNARLDLTANDGTVTSRAHYNLDGYRLGAGIEQSLTPRTYAKIEYRYSNYSDARFEYPDGANTNNFDVDTDRHQILAGVGFRF